VCKLVTQCARHLEVRRHESVVDNDTDARPLMSNLHNGSNVDHLHCWVCRRLNPDNLQCRQSLSHTQTNTVTHWVCRRLNPDNLQCRQSLSHTQTNTVTHWVCRRLNPDNLQCRQSLSHTQTNTVTHWVCRRFNPDNLHSVLLLSYTNTIIYTIFSRSYARKQVGVFMGHRVLFYN